MNKDATLYMSYLQLYEFKLSNESMFGFTLAFLIVDMKQYPNKFQHLNGKEVCLSIKHKRIKHKLYFSENKDFGEKKSNRKIHVYT